MLTQIALSQLAKVEGELIDITAYNGMICLLSIQAQTLIAYYLFGGLLSSLFSIALMYTTYTSTIYYYSLLLKDKMAKPWLLTDDEYKECTLYSNQRIKNIYVALINIIIKLNSTIKLYAAEPPSLSQKIQLTPRIK